MARLQAVSAQTVEGLDRVKPSEIQFHHEVTNQFLWNEF